MVSIIIPAFNEEKHLPTLLDSINRQTYTNFEVIVADANSNDQTRKIAKNYGCKVVDGGMPAVGRNNGAKSAKKDLLLFLDADVQLEDEFLEKAVREMEKRDLNVATCHLRPMGTNAIDKAFFKIFNLWVSSTQFFYPHASGAVIFCRPDIHDKVKGFDETIRLAEDMDYIKRCAKVGKFRVLKDVKAHVSMRRFEKEGRLKVGSKILLGAFHRIILGEIRSNVFNYELKYRK